MNIPISFAALIYVIIFFYQDVQIPKTIKWNKLLKKYCLFRQTLILQRMKTLSILRQTLARFHDEQRHLPDFKWTKIALFEWWF